MSNALKFVAAAAMLAVTAGTAQAQTITYSTQYSCNGTTFSTTALPTITCSYPNGVDLTFVGQASTTVTAPTNIDFGTVQASNLTAGGFSFTNQTIFLRIVQSGPTAGTVDFTGSLSGSVPSNAQSTAIITWTPDKGTIAPATYDVEFAYNATSINAPVSGAQTVRGSVTATTATPEPASMVLLGTGLVGLLGVARRKKNNA